MASEETQTTVFDSEENADTFHPLAHEWTLSFDDPGNLRKIKNPTDQDWKDNVKQLHTFKTVEEFWQLANNLVSIEDKPGCSFHLFRKGIKPMWEDPNNINGGKWVYVNASGSPDSTHELWLRTMCSLIGNLYGEHQDQICGAVVAKRKSGDKISLWTKGTDEVAVRAIGATWKREVDLRSKMTFQANQDSMSTKSSYRSTAKFTL